VPTRELLAQLPGKITRVGFLSASNTGSLATRVEAFRRGLRELGYIEGRNIAIEYRWAEGRPERLPALAAELERLKVDVIVTAGPSATRAAKQATRLPIVMAFDSDPVGSGFVASLARPGGNITGLSILAPEIAGKQLDVLRQIIPKLARVAALGDSNEPANNATLEQTRSAAGALGVQLHYYDIRASRRLEEIFQAARKANVDALMLFALPATSGVRDELIGLAAKHRLPVMSWQPAYVHAGGLMTYSANLDELHRRAATYVDKIVRGAKPGDLPVELPYKFELVINLKSAKEIDLAIPVDVLTRADRVIR
jgi:putative ABC transport system substrate-binding protein